LFAGSGQAPWWGVTWTQPAPTTTFAPVSVTTVCSPLRSLRPTWLTSPRPAVNRSVPLPSTASVDADAEPATARTPVIARTEKPMTRMKLPPIQPVWCAPPR
jgi:hypothetical protein